MYSIEMGFRPPKGQKSQFRLRWKVLDTPAAMLWMKLLLRTAKNKTSLYPRFTGFISPHKTHEDICNKLNQAIEIINRDTDYVISERAEGIFTQEFSNRIHHHFELLAGPVNKPTTYLQNGSRQVKAAIASLNHCIHDLESLHRSQEAKKNKSTSAAALTLEAEHIDRFKLPEQFYEEFSLNNDYGDMVLHYAQIGKTWWEVFLDQDHEIFNEAILPLEMITGEFDVYFLDFKISTQQKMQFEQFLKNRGLDPQDPSLRLGYLNVAKIEIPNGWSQQKCTDMIATHELEFIHILENGERLSALNLDPHIYDLEEKPATKKPLVEVKNLCLSVNNHYYQPQSLKEVWIQALSSPVQFYNNRKKAISLLSNISFDLYDGDRVAILGVNGSGKTTLCHCLSQYLKPSFGSVKVHCESRSIMQVDAGFFPELTGRENTRLMSRFLYPHLSDHERENLVSKILHFSELNVQADMPVEKYSLGMRSRLAQALVSAEPMDFLVLDEISGYVDEFFLKKIQLRLKNLVEQSRVTVLVSHNAEDLLYLCNRGLVIDQGKLIFDGPVDQAIKAYRFLHNSDTEKFYDAQ